MKTDCYFSVLIIGVGKQWRTSRKCGFVPYFVDAKYRAVSSVNCVTFCVVT